MAHQLVYDLDRLIEFSAPRNGLARCAQQAGIGLERDGELVAAVVFEGINKFNLWMHVSAIDGARWMTRAYLRAAFAYPFLVCKVQRISGYVEACNVRARAFNEHLGFRVEAVLEGAAKDGGDVLIYRMLREECRYVPIPSV